MQTNKKVDKTNESLFRNYFEKKIDSVWQTIVSTDVDAKRSHVELLFGAGPVPWNGKNQKNVTYYLTSQPVTNLVLLSFNSCISLCTETFPRCYRVTYASQQSNDVSPQSSDGVILDSPRDHVLRQCGRKFSKSRHGVRNAVLMARYAHLTSLAKERQQWAVLVLYSIDGSHEIVDTWDNLDAVFPETSVDQLKDAMAKSEFLERCGDTFYKNNIWWSPITHLVIGLAILLFVLVLIGFVSSAIKKHKRKSKLKKQAIDIGLFRDKNLNII